jgi:hypothetical protein
MLLSKALQMQQDLEDKKNEIIIEGLENKCNTRILGVQNPGANINTRYAGTKSHTYDVKWHRVECHIFIYNRSSIQNK